MVCWWVAVWRAAMGGAHWHVAGWNSLKEDYGWHLDERPIHARDAASLLSFHLFYCNYRDIWSCFIIKFHKLRVFRVGCLEWNNQNLCEFAFLFIYLQIFVSWLIQQQQDNFIPSKPIVTGDPRAPGESKQNEFPSTIPLAEYDFSTVEETVIQRESVLFQSCNRNSSRENLGQSVFAKRGEKSPQEL